MSTRPAIADGPSDARVLRTIKDGYWDRTELIELADGTRRVRKQSRGGATAGPWGLEQLRGEVRYLRSLSPDAAACFPPVFAAWGDGADEQRGAAAGMGEGAGYEMAYLDAYPDAGALAQRGALGQGEIDRLQDDLAAKLFGKVHAEAPVAATDGRESGTSGALSAHVRGAVTRSLDDLAADAVLAPLIEARQVVVNGQTCLGPRAVLDELAGDGAAFELIDATPQVRIHGDFFLENVLWGPEGAPASDKRAVLIDPVSVAGVARGPAVFDLVKYESYASGELLALRSHWVEVNGFDADDRADGLPAYSYRLQWDHPGLAPIRGRDWCSRLRAAYVSKYGQPDDRAYRLIDGYFSAVMAVNTAGVQRQARLLKCVVDLNAARLLSDMERDPPVGGRSP